MADYQSYKQINGGLAVAANSLGPAQVSGFSTAVTCQFYICNKTNGLPAGLTFF